MTISYRFRIYPNQQQIQTLERTMETSRLFYNESLEERRKDWGLRYYEQKRNLTQKRKIVTALQKIHSQVLQNVVWRLDQAYQQHHKHPELFGLPTFRRRFRYNSITYPQLGGFQIIENKLRLAFIDGLIKVKFHRDIPLGLLKTCTIIRDIDRCFVCFSSKVDRAKITNGKTVGIDVGIMNWLVLDTWEMIDRPKEDKASPTEAISQGEAFQEP